MTVAVFGSLATGLLIERGDASLREMLHFVQHDTAADQSVASELDCLKSAGYNMGN